MTHREIPCEASEHHEDCSSSARFFVQQTDWHDNLSWKAVCGSHLDGWYTDCDWSHLYVVPITSVIDARALDDNLLSI